jgi:hypothetical protein
MIQMPKPRDLAVVREDNDYIIIDDGINNRIALRKPISPRWKQNRTTEGRLISIQLMVNGVCSA